jgi:hypothetical protein
VDHEMRQRPRVIEEAIVDREIVLPVLGVDLFGGIDVGMDEGEGVVSLDQ